MFNSIKSAKRKVITFDDDNENVLSQGHDTQSTQAPAEQKSNRATKTKTQKDSESSEPTLTAESPEGLTPSTTTLTKKQKRQQQHQYDRPKKIANKEPTTEAILAKAKDLKKHREALPIYTGKYSDIPIGPLTKNKSTNKLTWLLFLPYPTTTQTKQTSSGYHHQGS
jgi:hypothetical protein